MPSFLRHCRTLKRTPNSYTTHLSRWVQHGFEVALLTSTFLLPLSLLNPQAASAASCSAGTITRVSSPVLYIDTGITPTPRGMYVGYRITNTSGAAYSDLWVKLENFTGGIVTLGLNEDGIMHVGSLASGASKMVYFFVTATGATATAQSHTVSLYSTRPDLASSTCGDPFSLTVEETIKAVANKITTTVAGPNPPELGGIMTMTVTGQTGTIGTAGRFALSPASYADWPANSYQLVGTQISMSGGNTVSGTDTLYFTGLNSPSTDYTIVYTFVATGSTVAPTTVSPISQISSGTQIKHNDTDTGTLAPISPTVNNLTLNKSVSPATLPVGGTATYTVTLTNTGTIPVTLDDIVDVLPSTPGIVSYVAGSAKFNGSAIANPSISGQTLTFLNLFTVPAGGTSTLTYQATVPNTVGTYTNRAVGHIGSTQIDTTTTTTDNAPATANVGVGAADLTVTKSHTGNFTQGQTGATYTLTVNNIGAAATSGTVTAIDTLPSGLTATAASGTGWTCTLNQPVAGQVQCTRSDALAAGSSYPPITVTVNVAANAAANVTNTVIVAGGGETNVSNDTASDPTTITPLVSISGKVWDDADNSANNTFTNINTGSEAGTNAGGLNVLLVNSLGNVIATTPIAADGTYTFNSLTTNQTNVTLRLSTTSGTVGAAAPAASVPTNWKNTSPLTTAAFNIGSSNITGQDFGIEQLPTAVGGTATSQANPTGTNTVTVASTLFTGSTDPDGTIASYKITAFPSNATSITIDGANYTSASFPVGGVTVTTAQLAGMVVDPVDGAVTVGILFQAIDNAGQLSSNTATVSLPFSATADLSITKTDGQTSTTPGSAIAYTITVTNNDPITVTSVTLNDTLPASIQSPVFTPSTGSYNNGTGAWTGLNLASGQSITLTVSGTIAASATGTLTNTATVAPPAGITDPVAGNNSATDTTTLTPTADLRLTKTVDVPTSPVGSTLNYTVTVTNNGSDSATNVAVQDLLPAGVTFTSATPSQGTYNDSTGLWTVGTIANGGSATLQIAVIVNTSANITNTAEVSASDQTDPNSTPGNNNPGENDQDSVTTPFSSPRLQLVKRITAINGATLATILDDPSSSADNAPNWPAPLDSTSGISTYLQGVINGGTIRPGDLLEYTIYFLSDGGVAATDIDFCDLVPSNSTFVPDSFSSSPESGINLTLGSTSTNLTNVPDGDAGHFLNPGAIPAMTCSAANTNGAVMVEIVKSPVTLPNATAPGTPTNSYGFIRFKVRIN
jgi:uncharacterized repeat protein (TIGR01451 family)